MLHINVYTRLLSGLEAFCLGVIDFCRLGVAMGKKLRFLEQGAACEITEQGAFKAVKTLDLWRKWRLVPPALELAVRRLRCWHKIVSNTESCAH